MENRFVGGMALLLSTCARHKIYFVTHKLYSTQPRMLLLDCIKPQQGSIWLLINSESESSCCTDSWNNKMPILRRYGASSDTWMWQKKKHFCAVSSKWHFDNIASKSTTRSQLLFSTNQFGCFQRCSSARPSHRLPGFFFFFFFLPPKVHLWIFQQVENKTRITSREL